MCTIRCLHAQFNAVLLPLFAASLLLPPAIVDAAPSTIVVPGTLGGTSSEGLGVNASGVVVGESYTSNGTHHAFRYFDGGMGDLGTLGGHTSRATGINNSNQVVGWAEGTNGLATAFLYSNGIMKDLGTLGGPQSHANGINDSGQVVGTAHHSRTISGSDAHAFLYDGSMRDLGTLGGTSSSANAINNSGQIVGNARVSGDSAFHAFLYNGSMQDLGTLGGRNSTANAINNSGQVVGWADLPGGSTRAFLYDGTMHDLGTLGGTDSWATGINDSGHIVGSSYLATFGVLHAFLYRDGTMIDLNVFAPPGWTFTSAAGINRFGDIVGTGVFNGQAQAFLLTPGDIPLPEPGTYATFLMGSGWIGLFARRLHRGSKGSD